MTEKPHILFVDDERQILISLRALFRNDYRVSVANEGKEALEILRRDQVDAIISDQRMPNMLGHELLRRAKKVSPGTMRLLLTGYSDLGAIMNSINDGEIFRFIHKPWNNAELRAVVKSAVQIAQNTRSSAEAISEEDTAIDPEPIDPEPPTRPAARSTARPTARPAAPGRSTARPAAAAPPRSRPAPVTPTAPALRPAQATKPTPSAPEKPPEPTGPAILVLDDKLDTFTRLRDIYQYKHPVRLAHTVEKAVEVLDKIEVGLLVTDVYLNGEDTTDFIKVLKQQYPMILTLVLTEVVDSELAIELINQGRIYRYLRKPAGDSTLKLSINQGLRFYQANKQRPELVQQQETEQPRDLRNPTLTERLFDRLRTLRQRLSFGF